MLRTLATRGIWPQVAVAIVLFAAGALLVNGFGSYRSIVSILVIASFVAIASSGQTSVALLGGIDLSIPAVMAMANVLTASLPSQGWPIGLIVVLILTLAIAIGALNGAISRYFNLNPLIVTLATGTVVSGGILAWTGGRPTGLAPGWLTAFVAPGGTFFGLPFPGLLVFLAAFAAVYIFLLRRTVFGRWITATGNSSNAAVIAAVPVDVVWPLTFAVSAVGAAIAGALLAGFTTQGDIRVTAPYLFSTVACVVIGGTSLSGGRGGFGKTLIGALILTELNSILVAMGFSSQLQQALLGGLILVVVAFYGREPSIRQRF